MCIQHAAALSAAAIKLEHETSAKDAFASQLAEVQAELTRAGDDASAAKVAASRDGAAARTHAEALAVAEGLAEGLRQELAASQAQMRWLEQQSATAWASCEAAEARARAIEQGREEDARRHARRQQQLEQTRLAAAAAAAAAAQQQQHSQSDGAQALSGDQRSRSASPSPAAAATAALAAAARLARVPSGPGPTLSTAWSERSGFTSGVTSPRGSSRSGSRSIAEYLSEHRGSDYRGDDGGGGDGSECGGSEYGGSVHGGVYNTTANIADYEPSDDVNSPASSGLQGSTNVSSVASSALSPTSAPPMAFVAFRASFGPGPIGLQFDVDEDAAAQNQLSLVATHASGAAADAGVQPGDLIAEVDGEQLPDGFGANQLFDLLVSRPRPVTLGFVRQASEPSGSRRSAGGAPGVDDE